MPQFLNVDFEFTAPCDLSEVASALGNQVLLLRNEWHAGLYYLSLELLHSDCLHSTQEIIAAFFGLLDTLPLNLR